MKRWMKALCLSLALCLAGTSALAATPSTKPAPKVFTRADLKAWAALTPASILKKYGRTEDNEANVSDVMRNQQSVKNCELEYHGLNFTFYNGKIVEIDIETTKFVGPRGVKVGMKEWDALKLFPITNQAMNTALTNNKSLSSVFAKRPGKFVSVDIYGKGQDYYGWLSCERDDDETEYQAGYIDYKDEAEFFLVFENGRVKEMELHFYVNND